MITAISNANGNNSNFSLVKQRVNKNFINNVNNSKQSNQVSFAANPLAIIKGESKLTRLVDVTSDIIANSFRKLTGHNELPFSKKPLIAADKGPVNKIVFGPDGLPVPDLTEGGVVHEIGNATADAFSTISDTADNISKIANAADKKSIIGDVLDFLDTIF